LDFFFRKIIKDQGRAIGLLGKQIGKFAASGGDLASEKSELGKALQEVNTAMGSLVGVAMASQEDPKELYKIGQSSSRLLMMVGDLITVWLLLRQAEIANTKMSSASDRDRPFYEGKVASAKFFIRNILPNLATDRAIIENVDNSIMEISENAF